MSARSEYRKAAALICNATALRQAARHVSRAYDRALASAGLRGTQYVLLLFLSRKGSATIPEIADALATDASNLGHGLRPLERDGLVMISRDPSDRRRKIVDVTDLGRERTKAGAAAWQSAQDDFERAFGEHDARAMRETMRRIADLQLG